MLFFHAEAALDVLPLAFFKQIGARGHTNSHDRPHFLATGLKCRTERGATSRDPDYESRMLSTIALLVPEHFEN